MKYAVITFGCRVNQADSTDIERVFRSRGDRVTTPEDADVVVVNTCSVTATADHGARQLIRKITRRNPQVRIIATGCYATREEGQVSGLQGVTAVIPNSKKSVLEETLTPLLADFEETTAQRFGDGDGSCGDQVVRGFSRRTSYTLRVQTGCDEKCAYCIIPSTRGFGRSSTVKKVLAELDRITEEGFKEAALTGVHLGSYGRDLSPGKTLLDLLRVLDSHPSDIVFRISSLEPMDCTVPIVDLVARSGRFAPHFHLPLQNASDRLLRAMRRPYTFDQYRRLVDKIRQKLPHAGIGSDMVLGFPGESPEDFESNVRYLPDSPLTYLHVFPYSDRPGTEASGMAGKVNGLQIKERCRMVRELGAELGARFRKSQIGTVRSALTINEGRVAVTDNYLKVNLPPGHLENKRIFVRMLSADEPLLGEVVG